MIIKNYLTITDKRIKHKYLIYIVLYHYSKVLKLFLCQLKIKADHRANLKTATLERSYKGNISNYFRHQI